MIGSCSVLVQILMHSSNGNIISLEVCTHVMQLLWCEYIVFYLKYIIYVLFILIYKVGTIFSNIITYQDGLWLDSELCRKLILCVRECVETELNILASLFSVLCSDTVGHGLFDPNERLFLRK